MLIIAGQIGKLWKQTEIIVFWNKGITIVILVNKTSKILIVYLTFIFGVRNVTINYKNNTF